MISLAKSSILKFSSNQRILTTFCSGGGFIRMNSTSSNCSSFEIDVKGIKDEEEAMNLIKKTIESNALVLFMKGNASRPMCGFSNRVTQILLNSSLLHPFATVNVLSNEEIRSSIKKFSEWPTVPQLYVKGKFVGGCDIVYEMYSNGSFNDLLNENELLCKDDQ